jgi:hypothetical protein
MQDLGDNPFQHYLQPINGVFVSGLNAILEDSPPFCG